MEGKVRPVCCCVFVSSPHRQIFQQLGLFLAYLPTYLA